MPEVIVAAIIRTTPTTERRSQMVQDRPLNRAHPEGNVAPRLSDEGASTERSQSLMSNEESFDWPNGTPDWCSLSPPSHERDEIDAQRHKSKHRSVIPRKR